MGQNRLHIHHRVDQIFLKPDPEEEEEGGCNKDCEVGIDLEKGEEIVGNIHGHHHEVPVGEIDDLHHPHDEGHAETDQRIEPPEEKSRDQGLQKELNLGSHKPPSKTLNSKLEIRNKYKFSKSK